MKSSKPVIGIGACLAGQPVRYTGEAKRKNSHIEDLKEHMTLNSFCPEMAIGLGVPRKPVRLVGELEQLSLRDSDTQTQDYTAPIQAYATDVIAATPQMSGYILVKGSPSCGYQRVKRYNEKGNTAASDASGIFAAALMKLDPLLPLEEDGRLHDHALRENFISRVYAYHDWKVLCSEGLSQHQLSQFWSRYKYLAMSRHVPGYQELGRTVANLADGSLQQRAERFITLLMAALKHVATRKTHSNVLQHIRGYLKNNLEQQDKIEVDGLISQYKSGVVPLVVPLTLLRHHFRNHHNAYIDQQVYMAPYPEQLRLRNYI